MRKAVAIALMVATVLWSSVAMAQTAAVRPPFRLDQLVTQPTHTFPCNYTGNTAALATCNLASYFIFSGSTLAVDLASFFSTRSVSTASCLTGGGDLGVSRRISIQGHCIDPTLLALAPAHTFLGNNA